MWWHNIWEQAVCTGMRSHHLARSRPLKVVHRPLSETLISSAFSYLQRGVSDSGRESMFPLPFLRWSFLQVRRRCYSAAPRRRMDTSRRGRAHWGQLLIRLSQKAFDCASTSAELAELAYIIQPPFPKDPDQLFRLLSPGGIYPEKVDGFYETTTRPQ